MGAKLKSADYTSVNCGEQRNPSSFSHKRISIYSYFVVLNITIKVVVSMRCQEGLEYPNDNLNINAHAVVVVFMCAESFQPICHHSLGL